MSNEELISVMVPKKHLTKVYGYIAQLERGEPAQTQGEGEQGPAGARASDEWTPSRIRKMVQQSPPAMRDILRALAEHAGQWMTTEELAGAIQNNADADWKTVAGTLGAFGRRVRNRYGLETLPFDRRHDHEARGKVHRMSSEIAAQVLQALANGNGS